MVGRIGCSVFVALCWQAVAVSTDGSTDDPPTQNLPQASDPDKTPVDYTIQQFDSRKVRATKKVLECIRDGGSVMEVLTLMRDPYFDINHAHAVRFRLFIVRENSKMPPLLYAAAADRPDIAMAMLTFQGTTKDVRSLGIVLNRNGKVSFQKLIHSNKTSRNNQQSSNQRQRSSNSKHFVNVFNQQPMRGILFQLLRTQLLDVNITDTRNGRVLLHWAVEKNYTDIYTHLLTGDSTNYLEKVNVNVQERRKPNRGQTALHKAIHWKLSDVIQMLISNDGSNLKEKLDVNLLQKHDFTALHVAILCNNLQAAELLLTTKYETNFKSKINVDVRCKRGNTCLDLAIGRQMHGVADLIREKQNQSKIL